MGILDNLKSFVHSITTDDHYASYGSRYGNAGNTNDGSNARLNEVHRLATANSSVQSLVEGAGGSRIGSRNGSSANVNTVGYRPGMRSSRTNLNGSDVQLQNFDASGQPPLPSIDSLWARIEAWLEEEYPELEDNLNDGVTSADLNEFENDLGCGSLSVEFRQFYKKHDGQLRGGKPTGLLLGMPLLDLESILEEHLIWTKVAERIEKQQQLVLRLQRTDVDLEATSSSSAAANVQHLNNFVSNQRSIPTNAIQTCYSHRCWVPITKDNCGNQVAIDLAPGPAGTYGQIILFGRDYDTKIVVASSFHEFIFNFVNDLEQGNFQIDQTEDQDQYGYLEPSRNDDDFMIGDEDEDQGELKFYDRDGKEFGKAFQGRNKLPYITVLKIRALRRFGVSNSQNFNTSFTPSRISKKPAAPSGTGTSRPQSPFVAGNDAKESLINMQSSSKVALPKETLIDENTPEFKVSGSDEILEPKETVVDPVPETVQEPTKQAEEDNEEQEQAAVPAEQVKTEAEEQEQAAEPADQAETEAEEPKTEEAEEHAEADGEKPLTKSQKKNQKKKNKKQNKDGIAEVSSDLKDVAL